MTTALLTTKLYVPTVRSNFVPRTRLTERLSVGLGGKLTLVIAPAGFGKTMVLSAWLDPQSEAVVRYPFVPRPEHVAWVSLDAGDNDATRLRKCLRLRLCWHDLNVK
ncbi:MAG: hypothetical protein H0X37_24640 [Herpetosiphonaceae bacterium]|nr:hypothetical protein [Herpetosiphonaceae bacterium]